MSTLIQDQGDRIKALRDDRGWSQDDLAERIAAIWGKTVKQQNIQQVESGVTKTPAFYFELCEVLETTPKYLRTGVGGSHQSGSVNVEVLAKVLAGTHEMVRSVGLDWNAQQFAKFAAQMYAASIKTGRVLDFEQLGHIEAMRRDAK